jgi:hypothetical protein
MVMSVAPIKHAIVRQLRSSSTLKASITGLHEGFAPRKTKYPFVTYSLHYAPVDYGWGFAIQKVGYDVMVVSDNSVDADNIDALVTATLNDAKLVVDGQSTLICRRILSLSLPDVDEEGRKIYVVGGLYEIWADQTFPVPVSTSFSADAFIAPWSL